MFKQRKLACSFCGKCAADVAKLVAGPKVFICDRCVAIASQIMQDSNSDEPPAPRPGWLRRMIQRIGRAHRRYMQRHNASHNESDTCASMV